ncbi:TolC family protein [Gluconobacter sp. OJB]|uniref:TolC family protein n=1 Tax=Gluconobacter sp. OJB TaxID=3145196 RepID=UPI0031F7FCBC
MKNSNKRIFFATLSLVLSGCATSELDTAPASPDQPWQPNVTAGGVIIPGKEKKLSKLSFPAKYTLPSNPNAVIQGEAPLLNDQKKDSYTLADLIDVAQSSNPQTRKAWNTARDAALAVGIIKSTYLPTLTATVVGGWSRAKSQTTDASFDADNYGSIGINGNPKRRSSGSAEVQTVGLRWLLFDFGRRESLISAARQAQLATNVLFTGVHQKIIYGVTTAFYTHAAASTRVQLLQTSLENAEHVQAAAEARLKQGQGTIMDVTQARQVTAQVNLRLVQAQGEEQNTYLALLNNMGVSTESRINLEDVSGRSLSLEDVRLSDEVVKAAVGRRPDVLAAYAAMRSAQSRISAARAAFLPSIFMTGNVAYSTGRTNLTSIPSASDSVSPTLNLSGNRFSTLILGGISVPIFDGGLRSAIVKRAQDQEDSAEATLRQTVNGAVQQIVLAENALHTSLQAYDAASKLRVASQTNFDAALLSYRSGTGSVTQTELAQNGLLDANLSRSDAYYAALIAAAGLAFGTGSLG